MGIVGNKTVNEKDTQEKTWKLLANFLFNIVIPIVIIYKFPPGILEPQYKFLFALAFPAGYFIYDFIAKKKANFISIVGFISIFLIGLTSVYGRSEWVALIRATVPLVIGSVFLISLTTSMPLIYKIFYNEKVLDVERIDQILAEKQAKRRFKRIFTYSTYMLAVSFLISSILNYVLAKILIKSPTGTDAFAEEYGQLMILSKIVIAVPSTIIMLLILWYIFHSMKKITGLATEELFAEHLREKTKEE